MTQIKYHIKKKFAIYIKKQVKFTKNLINKTVMIMMFVLVVIIKWEVSYLILINYLLGRKIKYTYKGDDKDLSHLGPCIPLFF